MRRPAICAKVLGLAMTHAATKSYGFWFRYYYFSP